MLLGWLLACVSPKAPEAVTPVPSHEATVVVRSYREANIAMRRGDDNVHVYVDFELVDGAPELVEHAVDGQLRINMARRELSPRAQLPWSLGQSLAIEATVTTSSPGYVRITEARPR